jgi:hypothetical protein
VADSEMPHFEHGCTAAADWADAIGWRTSRLDAAHMASVEDRAMSAVSGSTAGEGSGGAWRAGIAVGQRGPVGHAGDSPGVVGGVGWAAGPSVPGCAAAGQTG